MVDSCESVDIFRKHSLLRVAGFQLFTESNSTEALALTQSCCTRELEYRHVRMHDHTCQPCSEPLMPLKSAWFLHKCMRLDVGLAFSIAARGVQSRPNSNVASTTPGLPTAAPDLAPKSSPATSCHSWLWRGHSQQATNRLAKPTQRNTKKSHWIKWPKRRHEWMYWLRSHERQT